MQILTDDDLDAVQPRDAVAWMLEALDLHASGALTSPHRVSAPLEGGRLTFTAGAGPDWYGHRSYDTLPTSAGEQVTVAHDRHTGSVVAIHVGNRLGAMRTGALGGAAASILGPTGPCTVAIIGAGMQAWHQLWALSGVLDIKEVRITSTRPATRRQFAERAHRELQLPVRAVDGVREAVRGADMVVIATNSSTPVLDDTWLAPEVMVTTLGPKQVHRAEFGPALVAGADIVATDSRDQLNAYDPPALVASTGLASRVAELGDARRSTTPSLRHGRRVFLSVGLAGTEVHLLGHLTHRTHPSRSSRIHRRS